VLHEMGHLAGRADEAGGGREDRVASAGDLMADLLAPGVRRTQALDAVFGTGL
jgi:hypothetical protein